MKLKNYLTHHNKWIKGRASNEQGRVCLWQAYSTCGLRFTDCEKLIKVIAELYPDRAEKGSLVEFNDHPKTTFKDVRRVILKAGV